MESLEGLEMWTAKSHAITICDQTPEGIVGIPKDGGGLIYHSKKQVSIAIHAKYELVCRKSGNDPADRSPGWAN